MDDADYLARERAAQEKALAAAQEDAERSRRRNRLENTFSAFQLSAEHFYSEHPEHAQENEHPSAAPDAYWEWKANKVIESCKVLVDDGWRESLLALPQEGPDKARAIAVLCCGMDGDAEGIIRRLREVVDIHAVSERVNLYLNNRICNELRNADEKLYPQPPSAAQRKDVLPYDPKKLQEWAVAAQRGQAELAQLQHDAYRDVFPWFGPELVAAMHDPKAIGQVEMRADAEWKKLMGAPPITNWDNLEIIKAHVAAANYPPTNAGIRAWAQAKAVMVRGDTLSQTTSIREQQTDEVPPLASGDKTTSSRAPQGEKPNWDADTGELTFRGKVVKQIKNLSTATNIRMVLAAFQEEGWPSRIFDPMPGDEKAAQRLKDTLESLNRNLSAIRFSGDGTAEGICWRAQ